MLSETDFREFTFTNPASLFLAQDPEFFVGTAVESAASAVPAG